MARPPAEPLRIAAHISARHVGGAERRSVILLANLAARGHTVRIFCNTEEVAAHARSAGLDAVISPLRGDLVLHDPALLARSLRRYSPDVLILITFRRLWLGSLAARMAGVPRVIARIGLSSDIARSAKYRWVLRHWIHDVVLNAQSLYDGFVRAMPAKSIARVTVIPNGVDAHASEVDRMEVRAEMGIPRDAFVVGTVARLVRQKRIDRLLRAVAEVPDVYAVIAGAGTEREALDNLARDLGISARVRFLGHREDTTAVYAALDVFAVASDQEGMSSAMLEALAAGVTVVSTPVSGADEALRNSPNAGIVVGNSAESMAEAIRMLRDDVGLRRKLSDGARVIARTHYSIKSMADAWERLLLER